jgi:hypothetical protein
VHTVLIGLAVFVQIVLFVTVLAGYTLFLHERLAFDVRACCMRHAGLLLMLRPHTVLRTLSVNDCMLLRRRRDQCAQTRERH